MADSKKEKCIEGQPLPAQLYIAEAKKCLEKALAEKGVADPINPEALDKLIREVKNDNS